MENKEISIRDFSFPTEKIKVEYDENEGRILDGNDKIMAKIYATKDGLMVSV